MTRKEEYRCVMSTIYRSGRDIEVVEILKSYYLKECLE